MLIAHGHTTARRYPVGRMLDETRIVNMRTNRQQATMAMTLRMAYASIHLKDAGKEFDSMIQRLTED